jgi:catechol 2,3-dioxygenase-like lactoylglutathione lyase family enzyme
MKIDAIDHVQLAIPAGGEDLARTFYVGVLGLREMAKPPELAKRGGAWFENDAVKVHLGVDKDFTPARKAHAAFRVDEVQTLIGAARDAGCEVIDDDPMPGHDRIYVFDPFGNRLEFIAPLS